LARLSLIGAQGFWEMLSATGAWYQFSKMSGSNELEPFLNPAGLIGKSCFSAEIEKQSIRAGDIEPDAPLQFSPVHRIEMERRGIGFFEIA
jgi:hypothetical protein